MQHTDEADPLADSKRKFYSAVDEIKASILAAGKPRPESSEHDAKANEPRDEQQTKGGN